MKELFKPIKNDELAEAYSSKELYEFLGLDSSNYSRWIKSYLIDNIFAIDGEDYSLNSSPMTSLVGRGNTQDYALNPTFAKKLSMQAPGEKGEAARDYFIECEKILCAKSIFTIENGRIMTDSKLLSDVTNTPHESIARDIRNWVDTHCDIILEGDPVYFNKYRLVPKQGKGGVIGKMLCSNVFIAQDHNSSSLIYHMSDIAIVRFLKRHTSNDAVRNMLHIFKGQISRKELELSSAIWNFSLPEGVNESDKSICRFLSERAGMFSNFEYAKRCYEEFCIQNDIPRMARRNLFKAEYLRFGNTLK